MDIISDELILDLIKDSLEAAKEDVTLPMSIIRYGDGEAIILNGFKDASTFKSILIRQLGFCPTVEEAEQIRENLISAYSHANIIGIPCHPRLKERNDYWSKAEDIFKENIQNWNDLKLFTSIDVHSHFLDKNYYKKIMQDAEVINYISCRNLDEQIKKAFNVKKVNSFIIAPEAKFDNSYSGPKHFPDQFNKIKEWMDENSNEIEGHLCLVGAGFVGKIYCNWFRNNNGIAFDIGSIFDSWAGLVTRGHARGVNIFDDKYKL